MKERLNGGVRGNNKTEAARPRKVNECIGKHCRYYAPTSLFDEFWREGELALFFGPPGAGKSVMAVQAAEALARGRGLDGFRMPAGRRKVLYVDLQHSDAQFQMRYVSSAAGGEKPRPKASVSRYKFAEKLYRGRPSADEDLCDWLSKVVADNGYQIVIVDDLSSRGRHEMPQVMRRLRQLRDELRISILAVIQSEEPGRRIVASEADLKGARSLCNAADSVFAIGRSPRSPGDRYLIQIRSRNAPIFWGPRNAPMCRMGRLDTGLLGFRFDERFAAKIDEKTRSLICEVKFLRDAGMTYREIAGLLEIPRARAARLLNKWTPAMEDSKGREEESEDEEFEDEEFEDEESDENESEEPRGLGSDRTSTEELSSASRETDVSTLPTADEPGRRSVYDLKRGLDGYGKEIFIETEEEPTGKPLIWYKFDEQGNLFKFVRSLYGSTAYLLGKSPYL